MSKNNVARSVVTISVLVAFSKVTGFLREMSLARAFGTGSEMDAYSMSLTTVAFIMAMISAYLGTTFMPKFMRLEAEKGVKEAERFSSNVLCITATAAGLLSIIGFVFAPQFIKLVVPGFEAGSERFTFTVEMTRIMIWVIALNCITVILVSLLNSREAYVLPQLTGLPLNFLTIIYCFTIGSNLGARWLAALYPISFLIQIAFLYPAVRKQGLRLRPAYDLRDPEFRETLLIAIPVIVINVVDSVNMLVDKTISSSLPLGSVSALQFGNRLSGLFVAIIAGSIGTVLFTKVGQRAAQNDMEGIKNHLSSGFEVISFIMLPIIIVCMAQSTEITKLAYERGSFDAESTVMTATAFFYYILGLWGMSSAYIYTRTFYALQNTKSPMITAIVSVAVNIVTSIALSRVMGIGGVALGTAMGQTTHCVMQMFLMRKHLGKGSGLSMHTVTRIIPCLIICALVSLGCSYLLKDAAVVLRFVVVVLAGALSYAAAAFALKMKPLISLLEMAKDMLKRD